MAGLLVTVGGYVTLAAVAGVIYYSSQKKAGKRAPLNAAELKREKAKKTRESTGQSLSEKDTKTTEKPKKKPKQKAPEPASEPTWLTNEADTSARDEVDNREFARQLSGVKAGTQLQQATKVGGRQKSVKQSRAQEKPVAEAVSDNTASSSNAGGDADDDRSSANSPELAATENHTPIAGSISDMLETPTAGPGILRLTSPANPAPPKKQKTSAPVEAAETKKQRQNRKKAEEQKAAKAEAEQERKKQEEKQRRTAREAEGRAAKDGSTFMASKAPSSSAWTPGTAASETSAPKPNVVLLDTYEAPSKEATVTASTSESENGWVKPGLSEEEQLRRAIEDSDTWESVKTKKRSKKVQPGEDNKENKDAKESSEGEAYTKPKKTAPSEPGQKWKIEREQVFPDGKKVRSTSIVQDDEWEV